MFEEFNKGKSRRPYSYPGSLITFTAYLHMLLGVDYGGLQGFLRGLSRPVVGGGFSVPHYAI